MILLFNRIRKLDANKKNIFKKEIVPISLIDRKGNNILIEKMKSRTKQS